MAVTYFDVEDPSTRMNYRWVQPPQIVYFVTTIDKDGNTNVTPVTMGTVVGGMYFAFTFSNLFVTDWDSGVDKPGVKHGYLNMTQVPECVISYAPYRLLRASWITGLPIPRGISELDVAGLTPLPSRKVRPCGIAECPVNLEARMISTQKLGDKWTLNVCQIVGVSVDAEYVGRDEESVNRLGVLALDPIFEVQIGKGRAPAEQNVRLLYDRLDMNKIERAPEDVGCKDVWIGSFEQWLDDEHGRGKMTESDKLTILDLNRRWQANRDPRSNAAVKRELTQRLTTIVALPV